MDCAQCGETNRDGARFCSGCGTPLAVRCSNCRSELRPTAKFCDECGTPVANPVANPAAATPAAPAATATRKIVTALFADLVGSTSFGERADAEVARTVMARYHALLQSAIDAHGGTVSKFMGDGMMATFGIPEIAEDDALRAVRAGVDIQRRFTDFATQVQTQHGETLGLRVGVNTGEVVIADGDADLVGDALNVAARIEHACRPGQVTVGEDTWRLTRGEFGYDTLGEVTVAGRAQPVAIFEVAADPATAAVEMAAPFVGRTPEMDRLRAVLGAAISARAARLVTVLGSPGVGKTRLSRELCATTEADDGAITFEIRCDRAGDSTFAPIAQLIRDATELGDDTDAASVRERLGALLADDDADRDRLVDILGGLVGAAPSRSVEETFWAVRRLVTATAVDRPMVVVIDDIQWAEPLLLDLLEHLAEWVQDVPLLLLCLARPELREVRPSLAERNRRVEDVLALDGLDSAATEALAAGLLGTDRLPAGLVERLPTSTDGNPLFVRELVRMLVDDEVIRRRGDEWELAIDADAVEVPPTIQSLLAARVERLPGDERAVLELAAVIGSEFNLGALRELAGADTPLPSLLESMRRKELVEPTGTYWGDEPVHRFHHVLIRDATYRRLLKTTRADLHEKVAVWTDAAASGLIGEHEAVIAFHYEQAFRYRSELGSVDDHVTGLGRRAAELLSTASDRALGQDDLASAGALARRALALLPTTDAAARAELLTTACECTLASGDVVGARPVVEQLRAEAGDDPTLGAWASCFEAQLVGLTDPEGLVGAEAIATGAAKVMEELGDGAGEAKAHQVRAGLLARLGRVGDAELELDLALGAARRVDDRRRVTAVLGAAPLAALWGPSPVARAGGRCLDVVRLLRITTASPSVEATSMRCQAVLEALRGRFDVARSMLDSSRASLEELGLRHGLLETAYLTGVVELVAGDPAAAIRPLRDAYDGLIEMGVGIDAGRAAALLAHALVAEGRVDDAEPMAAASEELAGQDLKTAIAWRVARAEVLAARGDVVGGITLAREAVEIAAATDLVIDHADACVTLAALHQQGGDIANSRSVRDEAKRLYDLKGATVPSERLADEAVVSPAPIPAPTRTRASVSEDTGPRHPRAENIATQVGSELWKPLLAGDLERYRRLVTDDVVTVDRRALIGADLVGIDAMLANVRATAEMGAIDVHFEPLAVRGSVLGLGRVTFDFGGFESCFLALGEVTGDGRLAHGTMFDEDDLVGAIDELDARYFAGEGAAAAPLHAVGFRSFAAANTRDWDAYRDTYTPELVCTDRRQIGWPTLDRDGLVETIRQYTEIAPDLILLPRTVHIEGPAALWTIDASGTTPEGGAVEWVQYTVSVVEPNGVSSIEVFDEDDFAAALARLDELGAADAIETRTPDAENDAATLLAKAWDLIVTDRADEIGPMCADDAVVIDGQRIVGEDLVGRDAIVANGHAVAALGADAARVESLAVRGSRHALCRTTVSFGGFENVFLSVGELNSQGLARCIVTFNEEDLADALDELDDRYYAGEGAQDVPFSDFPVVNLVNRRDWSTLLGPGFPEFTQVDHRQLGWPTVDRQGWVATMQQYVELVPDLVMVVRKFHTRGNAALTTLDPIGTTSDGSAVAWAAHTVISVDPDRRIRMDTFDLEDFAAALARLDELGGAAPVDPRHPRAENTATRTRRRVLALFNTGRFDEARALLNDDLERVDRRTVVSMPTTRGLDDFVEASRASLEAGFTRQSHVPIAVRGDRLELSRVTLSSAEGNELVFLSIIEIDESGRVRGTTSFDEDALAEAQAELDERYLAGEGAAYERELAVGLATWSAFRARDYDAVGELLAPDLVTVDHQRIGFGARDRDGFVAGMRQDDGLIVPVREIIRTGFLAPSVMVFVRESTRADAEGGVFEWPSVVLLTVDGTDRIDRIEWFDLEDWDAALARLDELGAADPVDPRHPRAENTATRMRGRVLEQLNAGRFETVGALLTEDFERVDRRTVVSMPTARGREAFVESSRATYDAGFTHISFEPIAVRGDRLELSRVTMRAADGHEIVFLNIGAVDETGRSSSTTSFDEDALNDAVAELDARYVAGEGALYAPMLDTAIHTLAALQAEDWTTLTSRLTDDFAFVDHRQLSNPPLDREGYVATQQMFAEQIRRSMLVRTFHPVENAFLCTFDVTGTDAGGGAFEWVFHLVSTFDGEERLAGSELFDEDDFPAALARLDELGAGPVGIPSARLENAATRNGRRLLALINSGRIDEAAALLAPVLLNDDRRTTVSWGSNSREQLLEGIRASIELGLAAELREVIAIRGDGLSLVRIVWTSEAGDEIPQLTLAEIDADGRCTGWLTFDDEALDEALAELDARYLAGEGAEHADVLRPSMDHVAAFNRRDWAALLATMRPDIVIRDHRGLWPATSDRDAYLARMQSLAATSPDSVVISRRFVAAGNASLATYRVRATSEHGERYEYDFHITSRVADTFPGFEFFADDDFAAAHARFEELCAASDDLRAPAIENATTGAVDRFFELARAGDVDGAAGQLSSEVVRVDHRTAVADATTHGRDDYMAALRGAFDVGFAAVAIDHLAVRGERLALFRSRFSTDSGMQLVMLSVGETNADGLVEHISLYDEEAIDDAIAELDARYYAGEGAPLAPLLRVGAQFIADLNAQDWTGLPAALTDDFSFTDHGQVGWPPLHRDQFLKMQQSYLDQIRQRFVARSVQARGRAVLTSIEIEGVDAGGGEFEWRFHTVAVFDADLRISCMESYAEDDLGAALARLDELGGADPAEPRHLRLENAATRWAGRLNGQINGGSLDEVAGMYAVDVVAVDRRTTVSLPTLHGRAAIRDNMQALRDVGFNRFRSEALAVRGDRLVLQRVVFSTADGREMTTLGLNEWLNGEVVRRVVFDEDALADALVELDRSYAAGEGAEHADVIQVLADGYAAMNRRDLDAWAAIHAPDHTTHDHAPIGFGELGTQKYGEYLQAAFEQIPDFVIVPATIEVDGSVALVGVPIQATTPDGFEFEKDLVVVTRFAPDLRIVEDHMFAADQWPEAHALFASLAAAGRRSTPELRNTATDVIDRYAQRCAIGEFGGKGFGAPDFVRYDRRRGVSTPTLHGLAEFESNMRAIFEVFDTFTTEPVAIRGDGVALIRVHLAREEFSSSMLGVYETNNDGLLTRGTSFDEEDLDLAFDELEARFIAGEGADDAYAILRAGDVRRGAGAPDRAAAYEALHTSDCRVTDHRLLSWPTETVSDVIDQVRADRGISRPRTTVFATLEVLGDAVLIVQDDSFVTPEGSEYLKRSLAVTHSVAGRADSLDFFDPEQHDAARARFEQLGNETRTPYVDNAVVRLLARGTWLRRFVPDDDAFAGLADDLVVVDNRSGVSLPELRGAEELVQASREQEELFGPIEIEPVAVRGDRLALVHTRAVAPSGFETSGYGIFEIDGAGLQNAMTFFDDDDLVTALDALDARYAEIAGPERASAEAALLAGVGLLNGRDWDGFAELVHPDLEAVDHSPLGFPITDRDGFVNDQMRGMAELVPDFVVVLRKILAEGRATLVVGTTLGTTVDGNEYAWEFIQVMQTAADGRGRHRDLYADTQWTEALARFDELATEAGDASEPENRITRRLRRWLLRTEHGAPTSSATIADNVVILDRRSGVSAGTITGREDFAANARAHFDVFADARITVLAVRGDRLALVRMEYRADGFVSPRLNLFEADESGRIVALVVLDEDDVDAALEELDARHTAIGSAGENRATFAGRRSIDAFVRGDRDAAIDAFAPEFTRSDQRRGPTIGDDVGRDEYVDATLAGAEVGMAHFELTPIELAGDDRALATLRWHNGDGFELEWLLVTEVDADGRILRLMNFDVDERDAASAALHEWSTDTPQMSTRMLDASAARMDALARGDRDAVLATYTADFVREDRRRGINFGSSNREETVDALLAGNDVGLANRLFTTVEAIGDHFALGEFRMSHDDGFELVYLLAVENDDEGRLRRAANFDLEDRELTSALLREWAAERGHEAD